MYDKMLFSDSKCTHCGGKGYIEIYNAYDPDFKEVEICPVCKNIDSKNENDILLN